MFLREESNKDDRPFPINTMTYDQTISYVPTDKALRPEKYVILPFESPDDKLEYATRLSESIGPFRQIQTISRPQLASTQEEEGPQQSNDGGVSTGALIGIATAVFVAIVGLTVLVGRSWWKRRGIEVPDEVSREPTSDATPTDQGRAIPADVETVEAVPVDAVPYNEQIRCSLREAQEPLVADVLSDGQEPIVCEATESPNHLPTFKNQTADVQHGPQAPFVAHDISETRQERKAASRVDINRRRPDP